MTKKQVKPKTKANQNRLKKLGVTKPRKPAQGSLAWHRASWAEALGLLLDGVQGAAVHELARLSYENQVIRRRLETCETMLVTMVLGKVVGKDGELHLMECKIRDGKECSCGAVGPRETAARKGH